MTSLLCIKMDYWIDSSILASLNLPAALEDATSGQTLPESIKEKSSRVKSMGGIDHLNRLVNDLPSLLTRNQEILDEVIY